ncbi:DUF1573 domain-containing protein [Bernardetia sp.]|uniref:DUF1573 domain-containing protein n=1 Tax=Bernardetia sp. TaxID=1937974 RepID=UPI0025BA378D|nr:DUF1573 domain-containing protein [Bernardetia sp.]
MYKIQLALKKIFASPVLFVFLFVCFSKVAYTQNSTLEFAEKEFDFGQIEFQDTLSHKFYFKNSSEEEIKILDITTDCACTFSKENSDNQTVLKGDSSFVELMFLPYSYGSFVKIFTVKTDKAGTQTLMLKGELRPALDKERDFKYSLQTMPEVRTKTKYLHFGNVLNRVPITKKFEFYNASKEDLIFTGKMETPKHIQVRFDSSHILKAGELGAIYVIYDPLLKNDFGYLEDSVILFGTQAKQPNKISFKVTSNIEEYFPTLNVEMLEAYPELKIEDDYASLGSHYLKNLEGKDSLEATFVLKNTSNMPLRVHRIIEGYGCKLVTEKTEWNEILPHSNAIIKVVFQTPEDRGNYVRSLTLICNDPRKPIRTLKIKADFR